MVTADEQVMRRGWTEIKQ